MIINRTSDHYFLHLLNTGVLTVSQEGIIHNTLTNKNYIHKGKYNTYRRVSYKGIGIQAHRVVWMAFNGLIPENLQINHINGIKSDNKINNLEIATNSENIQHAFNTGLNYTSELTRFKSSERQKGENNVHAKLTDSEVIQLRQAHTDGLITKSDIQKEYSLNRRTVENFLLGRSYKHLPFKLDTLVTKEYHKDKDIIKNMYATGNYTQQQLAALFNITRNKVRYILNMN